VDHPEAPPLQAEHRQAEVAVAAVVVGQEVSAAGVAARSA
jgi:hypothetical protein